MERPMIGIVSRAGKIFNTKDVQVIEENNRNMVLKFGGIPIMILPPQILSYDSIKPRDIPDLTDGERLILKKQISLCDGLLMPGGLKSYSYDYFIDDYAKDIDIPILGECLGMQIMARNHGGANIIKNQTNIEHHTENLNAHKIRFVDDTKLSRIVSKPEEIVNSFHSYNVTDVKNMVISAYSEDGLVEAVEDSSKLYRIGVQWHPEKDTNNECNQCICEEFIKAAKVYKSR